MVQAEAFKREFDQHVDVGASRSAVDDYLSGKRIKVSRLNFMVGSPYGGQYQIETAEEYIPGWWYCGPGSVGVVVKFTADQRMDTAEVSYWSFNCP